MTQATVGIKQFFVQFNLSFILQLIKVISNDRQKILRYFSRTVFFTIFVTPSAAGFPKILDLYSTNGELFVAI